MNYRKQFTLDQIAFEAALARALPPIIAQEVVLPYQPTRFIAPSRRVTRQLIQGVLWSVLGLAMLILVVKNWQRIQEAARAWVQPNPRSIHASSQRILPNPPTVKRTTMHSTTVVTHISPAPLVASAMTPVAHTSALNPQRVALDFVTTDDAWIEVYSGTGERLYSHVTPSRSPQSLTGIPPLSLKIGNASRVTLRYKGQLVNLTPYTHANVATLELR